MVISAMEKDKGGRGGGWNFKPGRQGRAGKGRKGLCEEMPLEEKYEGGNHKDIMKNCAL